MKAAKSLLKLKVHREDMESIREAVKTAEQNTSGEIALAIIGESRDYAFYELMVSVIFGALVFLIMVLFHNPIVSMLDTLFWNIEDWQVIGIYGFVAFMAIAVVYLLTNIPAIDKIIIPKKVRRIAVYQRALQHFVESGVYATRDHNGILLFISLMEHEVFIIADEGLLKIIAKDKLDVLARELARGIQKKEFTKPLLSCITSCGEILQTHFPIKKDDVAGSPAENPNELPDGLVVLN
jgi:putative membrane protein